jgi:hypothetical protein
MPVETTANYIRIRVANPSQFVRFRIKVLGKGIKAVIGFKKEGGSQIQSLLFPRGRYDMKAAKAWVKSHGYSVSECFLVRDIIIDPITFDMTFVEETVTEEQEAEESRPQSNPWDWMFEDEDMEWTLYE